MIWAYNKSTKLLQGLLNKPQSILTIKAILKVHIRLSKNLPMKSNKQVNLKAILLPLIKKKLLDLTAWI